MKERQRKYGIDYQTIFHISTLDVGHVNGHVYGYTLGRRGLFMVTYIYIYIYGSLRHAQKLSLSI